MRQRLKILILNVIEKLNFFLVHHLKLSVYLKKCPKIPALKIVRLLLGSILIYQLILVGIGFTLDPNDYKNEIQKLVLKKTDYTVILNGPLKFHTFPGFGIEASNVFVKNKPYLNPLLKVENLRINFNLLPLLLAKLSFNLEFLHLKVNAHSFDKIKTKLIITRNWIQVVKTQIDCNLKSKDEAMFIDYFAVDSSDTSKKYYLKHQSNHVSLSVLSQILKLKNKLTGEGALNIDLVATGKSWDTIKKTLSGEFEIEIFKGKLQGFDLIAALKEAKSILNVVSSKLSHTLASAFDSLLHRKHREPNGHTPFENFKIKGKFTQGILRTQHLHVNHTHYHVSGKGRIDLVNEHIDCQLETLYQEKGDPKALLRVPPLVIHITGPFKNVSIKPDFSSYLQYVRQKEPNTHNIQRGSKLSSKR